jgi:phosphoglycolate phosphatase-like HAD superfamily hydrolase
MSYKIRFLRFELMEKTELIDYISHNSDRNIHSLNRLARFSLESLAYVIEELLARRHTCEPPDSCSSCPPRHKEFCATICIPRDIQYLRNAVNHSVELLKEADRKVEQHKEQVAKLSQELEMVHTTAAFRGSTLLDVQKENTALRALVAKQQCVYGYSKNGVCKLGYPGCACADDIAALAMDSDGAVARMKKRYEEQIADLRERLTRADDEVMSYRSGLGAGFGIITANPHKTLVELAKAQEHEIETTKRMVDVWHTRAVAHRQGTKAAEVEIQRLRDVGTELEARNEKQCWKCPHPHHPNSKCLKRSGGTAYECGCIGSEARPDNVPPPFMSCVLEPSPFKKDATVCYKCMGKGRFETELLDMAYCSCPLGVRMQRQDNK